MPEPSPQGLSRAEAQRRLRETGPNALPEAAPLPLWRRLARQFASPLVYLLIVALVLDLGLWIRAGSNGMPVEVFAIGLILVLNAGLGAYQEARAEEALSRLKAIAQPMAWARRDGRVVQVPSAELVPGDIVRLEAGDRVPADGRLVTGDNLQVDQSILTGESLPVAKAPEAALASGTLLVSGKGLMEVTRTGPASSMGQLAALIGGIEAGTTPLERRLKVFANRVALAILALGASFVIGGLVAEGPDRLGEIVLFAVALAVAAVPEGLPAVMTLTLALGVERLSRRRAVVRRLSAVEALGSVTVIATDKTGTLTENRMTVKAVDALDASGALRALVLANDAEVESDGPSPAAGDPLEVALLAHARASGLDPAACAAASPRLASRPFDSLTRSMRVTVAEDGRPTSYLKGAPEVLIARCGLDAAVRAQWLAKAEARAEEGYRVLALARGEGEREDGLDFLGLVMLWDPPRAEVKDALARAREAGIRVVMITGDHPATARAVAEDIGFRAPRVMTGEEIDRLGPGGLEEAVAQEAASVFARVTPEHKLHLVSALQAAGAIVAVTGDGVNDAPALKRADVGVAMGQRGSDVSREVADLVLADDNFATIVTAIEEGRSITENIQSAIRFLFSTNLALVILIGLGLAISFALGIADPSGGLFLPLTAVQLLWINVVADGPPALALALDRNPGMMRRPPRPPEQGLLDRASLEFVVATGVAKAVLGLALLVLLPRQGYSLEETRTAVFLFESVAQLMYVYPSRSLGSVPERNRVLDLTVALGVLLQVATLIVPALRRLLGLTPLDAAVAATVAIAILASWAAAEGIARQTRGGQSGGRAA